MSWNERIFGNAVGERIVKTVFDEHKEQATIHFASGATLALSLDGDCCSRSYFTNEAQFADLIGATATKIEERNEFPEGFQEYDLENTDSLSWHFLVFTTDKGHFTIDWRNDSNGYYDGSLSAEYVGPPHGPWTPAEAFKRGLIDRVEAAVQSDQAAENGLPESACIDWKS